MPRLTFRKPHVDWNSKTLLDRAGGSPAAVRELLVKYGFDAPDPKTVYVWRSRECVPASWATTLAYCVLRERRARLAELLVLRRRDQEAVS